MTFFEARKKASQMLSKTSPSPALDATCLLSFVTGLPSERLLSDGMNELAEPLAQDFFNLVQKRQTGLPVAYLTEKKSFWKHDFYVNPSVLIPKPDTELLVEKVLEELGFIKNVINRTTAAPQGFIKNVINPPRSPHAAPAESAGFIKNSIKPPPIKIADVCTGSGCVALSVLDDFTPPADTCLEVYATDISTDALAVARKNALLLGFDCTGAASKSIQFVQGDLLSCLLDDGETFDLICSNPPYVPSSMVAELLSDGRSEPALALDGGLKGMDLIQRLVPQAMACLKKGGVVLLETGEYNASATRESLSKAGFIDIMTYNDLGGNPRVTRAVKP